MYNKKVLIDSLKNLGSAKAPVKRQDVLVDPSGNPLMSNGGLNEKPYKKVSIQKSNIQGKGLFADEPIRAGEIIGLSHIKSSFQKDGETYLKSKETPVIGAYYNHSDDAYNAGSIIQGNKRYLRALKNIQPGEEIAGNYYEDNDPTLETPDDFKKGGSLPKMPRKKNSRAYSRSLDATNKFFTENSFFAKAKSRKNKVYDPNAKYYEEGGTLLTKEVTCKKCGWEWDAADGGKDITTCHKCGGQGLVHAQDGINTDAMTGMMKARLAYANEFGNPAAKRMINLPDNPYQFDNGDTGTHYMASYDNYAVPQIQDENGVLQLGDYGPESNEAIRFDSDEDANYFAEHYKDVSPGFLNQKERGGALDKFVGGGPTDCKQGEYWNGTKCVKIPKNTRIVYHTDKDVYDKAFAAESDSLHFYNNAKSDFNKFDKLGDRFSTSMSDAEWQKTNDQYFKLLESQRKKWHTDEDRRDVYIPGYTVNYKYKGPKSGLTIKPVGLEGFYREGYKFPRFKKPVIHNVYEEPIVEEKKIEEKIENLPLLKPGLIDPTKDELQGNTLNEEELELPNEEVESEYLEEGSPDTENPMEWVNKRKYNIDWNGIQIPYRLPRFRKPGSYGDLIKPGKKRYINLPTIESRNTAYLREEQDGGISNNYIEAELTPEQIQQYAKGGFIIEDISVPELTKANLGKIVKTARRPVSRTLITPPHQRGVTTYELPLYNIPIENNKVDLRYLPIDFDAKQLKFPLSISGESGYTGVYPNNKVEDNIFHFATKMTNPMEAGRAFKIANDAFPYPFPSILEPHSLSLDSYYLLLNMAKRKDWDMTFENYIPLNFVSEKSKLFDGIEGVPRGFRTSRSFNPKTSAEMIDRLNKELQGRGLMEKAHFLNFESIPGGDGEIRIPNYKLTRKYNLGGIAKVASKLTPGNALRASLYKGVNPANYNIIEKFTGMPSELYNNTFSNDNRAFRTGMSLKFGAPEYLSKLLNNLDVSKAQWDKFSEADKMMAIKYYDPEIMMKLEDIGKRRLDAWAVGLNQPQEYNTLEQIGDNTYKMLDLQHTPQFFAERKNDIIANSFKGQAWDGKRDMLVGLTKDFYDLSPHPMQKSNPGDNRWANLRRSQIDEFLGKPAYHHPWMQTYKVGKSPDPEFTDAIYDNDSYGVRGGYRWDVRDTPEGMQWKAYDKWDLNPFEKRGSAFISPSSTAKKYLSSTYFKPLQNLEALGLVGGKPFNIENNFLVDPKTFKIIKEWEDGGSIDYALGDEIDEATMKKLEKLGYTFEKI